MTTPAGEPENWPRVSVIVLNYDGWPFLRECITALASLDYPKDSLDVIVVDNGSRDGSAESVRREYPWVRVIALDRNLGFAGGNNAGLRASQAPYIVLLNNDTAVEPGWLKPLVRAAESDPRIGGCGSKILFFYDVLPLTLEVEGAFVPARSLGSSDERSLGVRLAAIRLGHHEQPGARIAYADGWYSAEVGDSSSFRWSSGRAVLQLPVPSSGASVDVTLSFAGGPPPPLPAARVHFRVGRTTLDSVDIGAHPIEVSLRIAPELLGQAERRIQNAGQELLPGGYCRDRGSWVEGGIERHSRDGSYEREEEVFALCGASMLLRRRMLDDIGLLDDRFFLYYEDVDLCWRARLAGWRMLYVPESVVRHVHCGSSGEWSDLFRFCSERNRLLLLMKNAPRALAWRAIADYLRSTGHWIRRSREAKSGGRGTGAERAMARNHLRVIAALVRAMPSVLQQRHAIRGRRVVDDAEILHWMVG